MQMIEAQRLRDAWGEKPCDHPKLEREYYLGVSTGDYVCTQCGKTGWGPNWPSREREEQKRKERRNFG